MFKAAKIDEIERNYFKKLDVKSFCWFYSKEVQNLTSFLMISLNMLNKNDDRQCSKDPPDK